MHPGPNIALMLLQALYVRLWPSRQPWTPRLWPRGHELSSGPATASESAAQSTPPSPSWQPMDMANAALPPALERLGLDHPQLLQSTTLTPPRSRSPSPSAVTSGRVAAGIAAVTASSSAWPAPVTRPPFGVPALPPRPPSPVPELRPSELERYVGGRPAKRPLPRCWSDLGQ